MNMMSMTSSNPNTTKMPMGGMGGMMTFHFGIDDAILFSSWKPESVGAFIGSCIAVFALAMAYEGVKAFRDVLSKRSAVRLRNRLLDKGKSSPQWSPADSVQSQFNTPGMLSCDHLLQSLLHAFQMVISYLLMLIAMTYNLWLFLTIILGAGFGHLVFGWRNRYSSTEDMDHC